MGSTAPAQDPSAAPGLPTAPAGNAVGSPARIQIDDDPELELLQVFGGAGIGSQVVVLDHDGTPVPG
ncbi:MAG: hypothetical protein AAFZ65_03170 [Planctomycetota bacterium]